MKLDNVSSTASSMATFDNDGKSFNSFNNQMAYSEMKHGGGAMDNSNGNFVGQQSYGKSPLYSDGKIYSSMGPNSSLSTNMPSNSTFSSSNMGGPGANLG
jgi:hypothetical protein